MKEIILIALTAVWIAEVSGITQSIKFWLFKKRIWYKKVRSNHLANSGQEEYIYLYSERRIKPFDCSKCMALWISVFYFYNTNTPLYDIPIYAASASLTAVIIENLIKRI